MIKLTLKELNFYDWDHNALIDIFLNIKAKLLKGREEFLKGYMGSKKVSYLAESVPVPEVFWVPPF